MKTEISPEPNPTYLSDEESESSYGIPVLVTNFPHEGRVARARGDKMPWGVTAGEWLSDLLGGGVESWLVAKCEHMPQVRLFLGR